MVHTEETASARETELPVILNVEHIATETLGNGTWTRLYREGAFLITNLKPRIFPYKSPHRFVGTVSRMFGTDPVQELDLLATIKDADGTETTLDWMATANKSEITEPETDNPNLKTLTIKDLLIPETGETIAIDFQRKFEELTVSATTGAKANDAQIVDALWNLFKKARTHYNQQASNTND